MVRFAKGGGGQFFVLRGTLVEQMRIGKIHFVAPLFEGDAEHLLAFDGDRGGNWGQFAECNKFPLRFGTVKISSASGLKLGAMTPSLTSRLMRSAVALSHSSDRAMKSP